MSVMLSMLRRRHGATLVDAVWWVPLAGAGDRGVASSQTAPPAARRSCATRHARTTRTTRALTCSRTAQRAALSRARYRLAPEARERDGCPHSVRTGRTPCRGVDPSCQQDALRRIGAPGGGLRREPVEAIEVVVDRQHLEVADPASSAYRRMVPARMTVPVPAAFSPIMPTGRQCKMLKP